jgi:RNA polymerase sigma-70 factor (ECF subfamily)
VVVGASPVSVAELFTEHAPFVHRLLSRFGVRDADVADACQDVFVVVQRKLPEFEGRAAHRTWLFRISARVASDYRKRAHRRYERIGYGPWSDEPRDSDAASCTVDRELVRRALSALAALDQDKQRVFVLHELEELTMPEVASVLGVPLKTAFSRFYAARKALQAQLQHDDQSLPAFVLIGSLQQRLPHELRAAFAHGVRLDPSALLARAGGLGGRGALVKVAAWSGFPVLLNAGAALVFATVVAVHERAPAGAMLVADAAVVSIASEPVRVSTGPDLSPPSTPPPMPLPNPAQRMARRTAVPEGRHRSRAVPADREPLTARAEPAAAKPEALHSPPAPATATTRTRVRLGGLDEVLAATSIRGSLRFEQAAPGNSSPWAVLPKPPRRISADHSGR